MDDSGDTIEDLSVDPELDYEDRPTIATLIDSSYRQPVIEEEYTEETVDSEGHHTKKNVKKGPGYETIDFTSDTPLTAADLNKLI